jgi:c-di-GMP-binding flagellar brake protein YcgR
VTRDESSAAPDLVTGPYAVRQLLEALSRSHAPLDIGISGQCRGWLTGWIEAVDARTGWLRIAASPSDEAPQAGSRLSVKGRADGVEVNFEVEIVEHERPSSASEALLRFLLPARAERLQRRGAYRIQAMRGGRLGELARRMNGSERRHAVLDLSGDGVGILVERNNAPSPGDIWRNCRLEIDQEAPIPCDLTVRTLQALPHGNSLRVGCAFERLPAEVRRSVERYVIDFQRAARGRTDT